MQPVPNRDGGAVITVAVTAAATSVATCNCAALPVLHLDEHYVVVSKPSGLLVHPSPEAAGVTDTVISRLAAQLGVEAVWPVHRIDRGTSGLLVLALSAKAAAALCALWRRHGGDDDEVAVGEPAVLGSGGGSGGGGDIKQRPVRKQYLALVAGATAAEFESTV